jgi:hypothetical protein
MDGWMDGKMGRWVDGWLYPVPCGTSTEPLACHADMHMGSPLHIQSSGLLLQSSALTS